jgi:probable HAF family extracellular repeat protein
MVWGTSCRRRAASSPRLRSRRRLARRRCGGCTLLVEAHMIARRLYRNLAEREEKMGRTTTIVAMMAISGLLATASPAVCANYAFTTIDAPGASGEGTVVVGINSKSQIVGYFPDNTGAFHGFLYTNGSFIQINVPGAAFTEAYGINNKGQIVGAFFPTGTFSQGFFYSGGSFSEIDVPGAVNTDPKGINDRGQIVGNFTSGDVEHGFVEHGFLYTDGIFTQIDVPDATLTEPWSI